MHTQLIEHLSSDAAALLLPCGAVPQSWGILEAFPAHPPAGGGDWGGAAGGGGEGAESVAGGAVHTADFGAQILAWRP